MLITGHFKIQEITRWFKTRHLNVVLKHTYPDDKLSQAKASQPEVEKYDYLKLKINLNMCQEGNSQGHKKDTNVFTGEDALNARSRTRFIVDNRKGDQD